MARRDEALARLMLRSRARVSRKWKRRLRQARISERAGAHEVALDKVIGRDRYRKCERPSDEQDTERMKLQMGAHHEEDRPMPDVEAIADATAEYRDGMLVKSMHEVALRLQDRRDHNRAWDRSE